MVSENLLEFRSGIRIFEATLIASRTDFVANEEIEI